MEINGQQIRSMEEKGKEICEKLGSFLRFLDKYTNLDSEYLEAIKTIKITKGYR